MLAQQSWDDARKIINLISTTCTMVYNFITSDAEVREQININYRFYSIKAFTFALLTEKGDVITREVSNTFVGNPLFKKGNYPLKSALTEFVNTHTTSSEKRLAQSFGVKIVLLVVEPYGRRAIADDDRLYDFDPLE